MTDNETLNKIRGDLWAISSTDNPDYALVKATVAVGLALVEIARTLDHIDRTNLNVEVRR